MKWDKTECNRLRKIETELDKSRQNGDKMTQNETRYERLRKKGEGEKEYSRSVV